VRWPNWSLISPLTSLKWSIYCSEMLSLTRPHTKIKEASGAKILEVIPEHPFIGGLFPNVRWILTKADWRLRRSA
jgi:hypothetical protein